MEAKYAELRRAAEETPAVDGHAHNLVAVGSSFPFLRCFSEAEGDALDFAPHSLSFKRSLKDIAELYNCEASLEKVEEFRRTQGLASIGSKCFQAANISAILMDDGIQFDRMLELESHKDFVPTVGRVLRIEWLAMRWPWITSSIMVTDLLTAFTTVLCMTFLLLFQNVPLHNRRRTFLQETWNLKDL